MENDLRTVDDILTDWKVARGTLKQGKSCEYFQMDWKNELENYSALINTLLDEGYTKEQLIGKSGKANPHVMVRVVNEMVYSGEGTKFTKSELLKCKSERAKKWELALKIAFPGKVCAPSVTKKSIDCIQKSQKPKPDIEEIAKNTIVMDTSDMAPVPLDEEFLAKLAALDAIVDIT